MYFLLYGDVIAPKLVNILRILPVRTLANLLVERYAGSAVEFVWM
jgi:hypothetical protein